jgi:hypothetical protein
VPNTELGHLELCGKDAERRASDRIRQQKDLSWKKWAARVDEYLERLEALFSPDLFIIGVNEGAAGAKGAGARGGYDRSRSAVPRSMLVS